MNKQTAPVALASFDPSVRATIEGGQAFNLSSVLDRGRQRHPDREAVVDGSRRLTYEQLALRSMAVGHGLIGLHVQVGDRVGLMLENCQEFIELFFGILRVGGVAVPINYRLAGPEVEYIVDHAEIDVLVTDVATRARLGGLDCVARAITVGVDYEERFRDESWLPCVPRGHYDLQRLMYTSGTTGRPKGVMIHNGAVYWKCLNQQVAFGLRVDDVFLTAGPLYHVGTLDLPGIGLLLLGGKLVLLERFAPTSILDSIEREGVTCTFLAPSMMIRLLEDPSFKSRDVRSLRVIIDGSEKMPAPLLDRIPAAFPSAEFFDGFGMTETVTGDTFLEPARGSEKLGSVGTETLLTEVRVVDDAMVDCPPNAPGELVVRGPKLCLGYWRDPEATAAAFDGGWFHTGDIAERDEDGYIYIVDRKKDMIKTGGENVSSSEVERVLYEHPAILESAVVGTPDERWGERVVAFVVFRAGHRTEREDLDQHCRASLAGFKVPKEFHIREALPRNSSGKVLKWSLRSEASDA